MLEVNAQPLRDLRALIEKIGETAVCRQLNVHGKTLYRWRTGRVELPGHQHLSIKALLGDLPGTADAWPGWRFWQGHLCSPAGETFTAGQVLSLGLMHQQLTAQRREIEHLRVRLAIAEEAERRHTGAANSYIALRA